MSNNDSFIDEVTEEVRRDRLFALFRRFGWIGVVVIIGIVGTSAWLEWDKASRAGKAQAFGDEILVALSQPDAAARAESLSRIATATPEQAALLDLLKAGDGTTADLGALATNEALPPLWRDLARFKQLLAAVDMPADQRRAGFEALTAPGAPFRLLSQEQIALLDIEAGKSSDAIALLQQISQDTEASVALRQRVEQLIVALGGVSAG